MADDLSTLATDTSDSSQRFPCANCGARLEFTPGTRHLTCPYCGHQNEIPGAGAATDRAAEEDFEHTLKQLRDAESTELVNHTVIKCDACAAQFERPENVTSMSCPFCASNIVLTALAARHIKPKAILPFLVPREVAERSFRDWLKSRWFAPSALKKEGSISERLSGVYLPAWTFDARSSTDYVGERGDAYYTTVGSGKNRRTVRRVRWRHASGSVAHNFDDVLVLASRSLPEDKSHALEPWDTTDSIVYNDAYLAGFRAECYPPELDLEHSFVLADGQMREHIRALIRADIGGDEQRIHHMAVHYAGITFKHLLLPVWLSAYRFRGRVFRFLVNARTGEVQGERPYSPVKIALAAIGAVLLVGLVILIVKALEG